MKKILTFFLALAASTGIIFASDTQVDGIWYDFDINSLTATVTYRGSSSTYAANEYTGAVIIPSFVTYGGNTYSVTSIGYYAFYDCTTLTSVTIPNSVTSIGYGAFYDCIVLTSVTIPNSVTSIGSRAFYGCSKLKSATIGNSVTSIGSHAFCSSGLTSLIIGNSVSSIGESAFYLCHGMKSVRLNSNSIVGKLYNSNSSLKDIFGDQVTEYIIGDSITSIGNYAFNGCTRLTSVTIPNGVTSIGYYAFNNCTSLTSIEIPNSVTIIDNGAFGGCTRLTSVTIPNGVTSIGYYAFNNCTSLTSIEIPNSVTIIDNGAFGGCTGLTSVDINNLSAWCAISFTSSTSNPLFYAKNLYLNGELISDLVIPNNVISIGNYAFIGGSIMSVTIPNNVTSIGQEAFRGCTGLTSVTIPNSVTSIKKSAFSGCSNLFTVTINSNTIISKNYSSSSNMKNIFGEQVVKYIIGDSVTSIGNNAFQNCSGLTSVTIGNSVTSIGSYAFTSCSGLTSIEIPNSVTSIGGTAFSGCNINEIYYTGTIHEWLKKSWRASQISSSYALYIGNEILTDLVIPNNTTSVKDYTFYGCNSLTSVIIGNGVTSIGSYAFQSCTGLTSIEIPNSVTSIGDGAFSSCSSLTSVTIGNSVTSIGSNAFQSCTGLTSIEIPNSVTSIGDGAFSGCSSLTSVTIGNSVTSIGSNAFQSCTGLTSIEIPNSVTSIGDMAFYGCNDLTSVTCEAITPPTLGTNVFNNNKNRTIYVPCNTLEAYKTMWSSYSSQIEYRPLEYSITGNVNIEGTGIVQLPQNMCENNITAIANSGYHFVQWSDGNADNPRTIILTQDTTFTAEFALNQYNVDVSCNELYGHIEGENGSFDYLTTQVYTAVANFGYHFDHWSDGYTQNPRVITVYDDISITALFSPNKYVIQDGSNSDQGYISGAGSYNYMTERTITAVSQYGYHFVQWSDGNADNPRTIILTQDTIFTAEFAIAKSGLCGVNNALTWSYNDQSTTLTITGNGALTENYTFGLEAPTQMNTLIIGDGVTAIGDSAFYGKNIINHLFIGANVSAIGNYAFSECRNFDDITCYATTVPVINETTFSNIGRKQYIYLYVPETRERAYKRDEFWGEFDVQIKSATSTTTDEVKVEPTETTAEVTWPIVTGAATYELVIQDKSGNVICTLIFNAQGHLTQIAFSAPSRHGARRNIQTAGFSFVVTGLEEGTEYDLIIIAKDSNGEEISAENMSFSTTSGVPTGIDQITNDDVLQTSHKIFHNGQILILRGEKIYTLQGQEIK